MQARAEGVQGSPVHAICLITSEARIVILMPFLLFAFLCDLQACAERIKGDTTGKECSGYWFDYLHCVDDHVC